MDIYYLNEDEVKENCEAYRSERCQNLFEDPRKYLDMCEKANANVFITLFSQLKER